MPQDSWDEYGPFWWAASDAPASPPYDEPATDAEWFAHQWHYPSTREGLGRYIHVPNRHLQRTLPTATNTRKCSICDRVILPYRPGKCPECWRRRNGPRIFALHHRTCFCKCPCLPEPDDETDSNYQPSDDETDEEMDAPSPTDTVPEELLALGVALDRQGELSVFQYRNEHPEHYRSAVEPQLPDSELSSLHNSENTVAPTEAENLYRPVFVLEIARLLDMGYTRNQIREVFFETKDPLNSTYIPPDGPSYPEAHASCKVCGKPRTQDLRNALEVEHFRTNFSDRLAAAGDAPFFEDMFNALVGLQSEPATARLCPDCDMPIIPEGTWWGAPGHCLCRCRCPATTSDPFSELPSGPVEQSDTSDSASASASDSDYEQPVASGAINERIAEVAHALFELNPNQVPDTEEFSEPSDDEESGEESGEDSEESTEPLVYMREI